MNKEFLTHYSTNLNREMQLNRYGDRGVPVVIFPSSGGTHNEYFDFGMIDACQEYINQGKIQFFTLSSIDNESWLNTDISGVEKARRHAAYDKYVIEEVIPFIKHKTNYFDKMIVSGVSMGGFHSMNFFLRHPDVFNKIICLSGIYDVSYFTQDSNHPEVFINSSSQSLWLLKDQWFIDRYKEAQIIVCTGRGDWEQDGLPSFYKLKEAFEYLNIPAFFDEWGYDVSHDWPWWQKQMPYFLSKLDI